MQFAVLPSVGEIYRNYTIPNNQIVHTFFIHWLLNLGISPEMMRLFPLICGGTMLFILWKKFARELGSLPLLTACTALVISPPFLLYASALRGYMLAALWVVCAGVCGRSYALGGRKRYLGGWFIFVLLSVGVMPSALAGVAAAGLYIAPYCGKKFWKNPRLYLLALAVPAAFVCFYGPISDKLLKAFALQEGWRNGAGAVAATAAAVAVTFFVPLASGIFFHRPVWRNFPRTLIWLLPLGGWLLPVSPFPRVWFVLFPFFTLLSAGFLRRLPEKYLRVTAVAALFWGSVCCLEFSRRLLSPAVSAGGQDDFYAPRFVSERFRPSVTAAEINRRFPFDYPVFVSFAADPPGFRYYRMSVIMDIPPGRIQSLPPGTVTVLAAEEEPGRWESHLQCKLVEIYRNGLHRVYIVR
ncbi:MAG: hypothetical protein J6S43_01785 [Lentisphaeria bacterium]|nr:hypothetical protein [Lentisphaeria bacterium]